MTQLRKNLWKTKTKPLNHRKTTFCFLFFLIGTKFSKVSIGLIDVPIDSDVFYFLFAQESLARWRGRGTDSSQTFRHVCSSRGTGETFQTAEITSGKLGKRRPKSRVLVSFMDLDNLDEWQWWKHDTWVNTLIWRDSEVRERLSWRCVRDKGKNSSTDNGKGINYLYLACLLHLKQTKPCILSNCGVKQVWCLNE